MRKRVYIFPIVLICLFGIAEAATPQLPFSLAFYERFGSIAVGDLNTTLRSYNSGYDPIRSYNVPWEVVGEIQAIPSRFTEWEVELQWKFWWGFRIGLAVSAPTQYSGSSFLTFTIIDYSGNQTTNNTLTSKIKVSPPFMLTLHKSVNLIRDISASLDGGIGLYRAQMTQSHLYQIRYPEDDVSLTTLSFDVKGRKLGYHLGIALEYRFNKRFSMITEGQWRFAKITTFKGIGSSEAKEYDEYGNLVNTLSNSKEGILYHFIGLDFYNGEFIEKLAVNDFPPPWYGADFPSDIRHAFLDLGCFTLKVGLRIGLF